MIRSSVSSVLSRAVRFSAASAAASAGASSAAAARGYASYAVAPVYTEAYLKKRLGEVLDTVNSVRQLKSEEGSLWRNVLDNEPDFHGKVVLHYAKPSHAAKTLAADSALRSGVSVMLKNKILEKETIRPGFRMLVLAPNRERALALHAQLQAVLTDMKNDVQKIHDTGILVHDLFEVDAIDAHLCTGGHSLEKETRMLDEQEPEIVVATPGRLTLHLLNSDYFRNLKVLVIDRADDLFAQIAERATEEDLASEDPAAAAEKSKLSHVEKRKANLKGSTFARQLRSIFSQLNKDRITICIAESAVPQEQVPLSLLLRNLQDTLAAKDAPAPVPESDASRFVINNGAEESLLESVGARSSIRRSHKVVASEDGIIDEVARFLQPRLSQKSVVYAQNAIFGSRLVDQLAAKGIYCSHVDGKTAQPIRQARVNEFNRQVNGVLVCSDTFASVLAPTANNVVHVQRSNDLPLGRRNVLLRESVTSEAAPSVTSLLVTAKASEQQPDGLFEKRE